MLFDMIFNFLFYQIRGDHLHLVLDMDKETGNWEGMELAIVLLQRCNPMETGMRPSLCEKVGYTIAQTVRFGNIDFVPLITKLQCSDETLHSLVSMVRYVAESRGIRILPEYEELFVGDDDSNAWQYWSFEFGLLERFPKLLQTYRSSFFRTDSEMKDLLARRLKDKSELEYQVTGFFERNELKLRGERADRKKLVESMLHSSNASRSD
jgi:hypothetical protein